MKVSVVIPAYNEEKYLPKTLESIKKLKRHPDEILVIDGGSTDNTCEVARDYGAKCVTVEHRGIGYARQQGVEYATGDMIAFTDADTIVPTDWLTKIIETLEKPGVAGVYSLYYVTKSWFPYWFYINYLQPPMALLLHYLRAYSAPGQNTAFWKEKAIAAGGYPTDFKIAEDLEMAKRLSSVGKMVYRPDNFVISSGRRGNEGLPMLIRIFKAFFLYFVTKKADKIGFPDIR